MLMTTNSSLFDQTAMGYPKALLNICDAKGNITSPISMEFRVKYPCSYAADRVTYKDTPHLLGTISTSTDGHDLIINAYVAQDFSDQRSINDGTLFDPTILYACLSQCTDALRIHGFSHLYLSNTSFCKLTDSVTLMDLLAYYSRTLPYGITVTV